MLNKKIYGFLAITFFLFIIAISASAQSIPDAATTNDSGIQSSEVYKSETITAVDPNEKPSYPVFLGKKEVFRIKSDLGGLTASERARKISKELLNKTLHSQISIDDTDLVQNEEQSIIYLRDALITLTKEDLSGVSAEDIAEKTKNAIDGYRKKDWLNSNFILSVLFYLAISLLIFMPIIKVWISKNYRFISKRFPRVTSAARKNVFYRILNRLLNNILPSKDDDIKSQNSNAIDTNYMGSWKYKNLDEVQQDYSVGKLDSAGKKILFIYNINSEYVIYLARGIKESDYVAYTGNPEILSKCNKFLSKIIDIYANQVQDFDNPEGINFQIASGIYAAINSTPEEEENVAKILEDAKNSVIAYRTKKDRLEYILSSFTAFIFLIIAAIAIAIFPRMSQGRVIDLLFILDIPNDFLLAVIFSALGGLLSVSIKSREIKIVQDIDSTQIATIRIYISIISGIIVYAIIRSNYIPDLSRILTDNITENNWKISTISAMAGFIEYFIPNLLTPKDNHSNKNLEAKTE